MKLVRIKAVILRQFYLMKGSPVRVLPMFGWVLLDILLWGFITKYLNSVAASGFSFVPRLLGAVLLWDFLTRAMHGLTVGFLEDVWSRNFLNIFASPLSISEYLAGLTITSLITSSFGLLAMILLAAIAFGYSIATLGLLAAPFVLVLFMFGISLGIVASALVLRLGPAGEWLVWPIPAVLAPFDYASIVLAVLFGYLWFKEDPSWTVWFGLPLVMGSGLYILHRERVRARERDPVTAP